MHTTVCTSRIKIILAEIIKITPDDTCPCTGVQGITTRKSICSLVLFYYVRMVIVSALGWINAKAVEMLCSGSSSTFFFLISGEGGLMMGNSS